MVACIYIKLGVGKALISGVSLKGPFKCRVVGGRPGRGCMLCHMRVRVGGASHVTRRDAHACILISPKASSSVTVTVYSDPGYSTRTTDER